MFRHALPMLAAAILVAASFTVPAFAGQMRVIVAQSGSFAFTPTTPTVNPGDQVFWVWAAGGHTVTSGTDGTITGDNLFHSSTSTLGAGSAFFWKAAASGSFPYYCQPHFGFGMKGTVVINPAGTSDVADFRITEVEFGAAAGHDRVQVTNLGTNLEFIDLFRISYQNGVTVTLPANNIPVGAGSALTIHLNASGTNNSTNLFFPAAPELGTAGSFSIYVPNTTSGAGGSTAPAALTDPNQMADYVEWGVGGQGAQPNHATAVSAGVWPSTDVVDVTDLPNGGLGYSISFCGTRANRGASFWSKTTPNFGSGLLCTSAARYSSWGRLKALYR